MLRLDFHPSLLSGLCSSPRSGGGGGGGGGGGEGRLIPEQLLVIEPRFKSSPRFLFLLLKSGPTANFELQFESSQSQNLGQKKFTT